MCGGGLRQKVLFRAKAGSKFSCMASEIKRFFLDMSQAVKKECALEVGCEGVWNLRSQVQMFLTM